MAIEISSIKKRFIENFFSLTLLRVLTLIVPLITFPYLIQTLGSENYGLVMWAWSIVNFFLLFINFGFNLSVTKYIAINRENKEKISEIISTTILTKIFLFFCSMVIFLCLLLLFPKISEHKELFLFTFLFTLGETMMPIWYFQGIEKMKYTAIITSFVKIFFTILVFLVIKEEEDYIKVPLLYAVASLLSVLFAYYIIYVQDKIIFQKPKVSDVWFYLKDSVVLFLSGSISVIKDGITILFIEHYMGLSAVAFFDIAQKFVNILLTPFHILSTVLYPHLSKTKDFKLLKKAMGYSTIIAIILYVGSYLTNSWIVTLLYGTPNSTIESILMILAFSIVFANLASLMGTNGLVVIGENKNLFLSSFYGMLTYLLILFIFIVSNSFTLNYVAFGIVVSFFADMIFRVYYLKGFLWQK